MHAALLLIYALLTSFQFDQWTQGPILTLWWAIFELTIILLLKYYQTYYYVTTDWLLKFVGLADNQTYNHAISVLGHVSMRLQFPFHRHEPNSDSHSW